MFYLDANNFIHQMDYNFSAGKWNMGYLLGEGYNSTPASSNSCLSAMYYYWSTCPNVIIVAFQDEEGYVQIRNSTPPKGTLTQIGPTLNPVMGTGLALQPFLRNGSLDQINLYSQNLGLNMSLSIWNSTSNGLSIILRQALC